MHGGYLAAIAVGAAGNVVGDRPIRTVTTNFLRPAVAKPSVVTVETVRAGRSITNLSITITQSGKPVVISQVIAAATDESTEWDTAAKLELVPMEQCVPIAPLTALVISPMAWPGLTPLTFRSVTGPVQGLRAICGRSNRR